MQRYVDFFFPLVKYQSLYSPKIYFKGKLVGKHFGFTAMSLDQILAMMNFLQVRFEHKCWHKPTSQQAKENPLPNFYQLYNLEHFLFYGVL